MRLLLLRPDLLRGWRVLLFVDVDTLAVAPVHCAAIAESSAFVWLVVRACTGSVMVSPWSPRALLSGSGSGAALRAARMYASSARGEASDGAVEGIRTKGLEREKVFTDITPYLEQLDAEQREHGGVHPKHIAAALAALWNGREHINEKGQDGRRLLQHVSALNSAGGVEGYTDLISALAKFGRADKCFAVFEDMKAAGLQPNEWTYTSLMSSCVPSRDLAKATQLLEDMTSAGLKPDAVTYTLLLKSNEGRSVSQVRSAIQVLSKIRKAGTGIAVRSQKLALQYL